MSTRTLIRLTTLILLFPLALLPGCIRLWGPEPRYQPDPMHSQMVKAIGVSGTNVTLTDGRTFSLAGVSVQGLTRDQIKVAENEIRCIALSDRSFLIQETTPGAARLVANGFYEDGLPHGCGAIRTINIIPIYYDVYPTRDDIAAMILRSGAAKADLNTAINATAYPYPNTPRFKNLVSTDIPPDMTYTQYLLQQQEEAKEQHIGIFQGPAEYLSQAVAQKDKAKVAQLLEDGADINSIAMNRTPLVVACQNNDISMIAFLLDHGAATQPPAPSPYDSTYSQPLITYLLQRRIPLPGGEGNTRILINAITNHAPVNLKLALQMGADPNSSISTWTPLMYAAREDQPGAVRILLQHGADPSIKDSEGKTALDHTPKHSKTRAILQEATPTQPSTKK